MHEAIASPYTRRLYHACIVSMTREKPITMAVMGFGGWLWLFLHVVANVLADLGEYGL